MKYIKNAAQTAWYLVIILMLISFSNSCKPYRSINVVNQTPFPIQTEMWSVPLDYMGPVTIKWNDTAIVIEPGKSQNFATTVYKDKPKPDIKRKYAMAAVIETNRVIFSRYYTWDELHDTDWKVIIMAQKSK